jgi:hypothetical protein
MDELIRLVTQKTGISQDQAQKAVTTVIGFLKEKLPAPIAAQLDGVIGGGGASGAGAPAAAGLAGMADQAKDMLGGIGSK